MSKRKMAILNYCCYSHLKMNEIYSKISKEMNIPVEVIKKAYLSYWKFIKNTIQELPLKQDLSEEEFAKLKVNFNIASLGKLSCTYDKYSRIKKMEKYKNDKN